MRLPGFGHFELAERNSMAKAVLWVLSVSSNPLDRCCSPRRCREALSAHAQFRPRPSPRCCILPTSRRPSRPSWSRVQEPFPQPSTLARSVGSPSVPSWHVFACRPHLLTLRFHANLFGRFSKRRVAADPAPPSSKMRLAIRQEPERLRVMA
jgi:hypothetical protein